MRFPSAIDLAVVAVLMLSISATPIDAGGDKCMTRNAGNAITRFAHISAFTLMWYETRKLLVIGRVDQHALRMYQSNYIAELGWNCRSTMKLAHGAALQCRCYSWSC
ncbi:hypothetical protein BDR07DRAFT_1418855 [Suillus spraguei]|nr:hypothetical protein BDR07DRAFT_1418855 [Suillus spraguei]